ETYMSSTTATLSSRDGRHVLRFERTLAHPPEKVWHALVDNDELQHWFPARIEGKREAGATLRFVWPDAVRRDLAADSELEHKVEEEQAKVPAEQMVGEIRVFDPPRTFELTWHTEVLRFELTPHAGGTLLVFTHTFDDRSIAASAGAGWHTCFAALEQRLAGQTPAVMTAAQLAELEADYRA